MIETKEKKHTNEPKMGLDFETVWAMFEKTERLIEENAKGLAETKKLMEENAKGLAETKKLMVENATKSEKETAAVKAQFEETSRKLADVGKYIKRVGKHIGEVDGRLGDIVEHLMSPGAKTTFKALGYQFSKATPNVPIYGIVDGKKKKLAEVDMFLESDTRALAIEIKVKAAVGDVNKHLRRMEILRQDADKHGDTRPLLGAIAGIMVSEVVRDYALEKGLFVIEQSGIDLNIVPPEGKPREW